MRNVNNFLARLILHNGKKIIGVIKGNDLKTAYIGHPINEKGEMFCGLFNPNSMSGGIDKIESINGDDFLFWLKKYRNFHKEILMEKGYDGCEENLNEILPYTK